MKLCKDCKHSVWPHTLNNSYGTVMCSHPDARRSVVTGGLEVTCAIARGQTTIINSCRDVICGDDARLFEERPPAPEPMKPGSVQVYEDSEFWNEIGLGKKPWWKRLLGG